ncbi:hypothetical protein CYMTET_31578, partial [Cymbomonas tetramitiformis]
GKTSYRRRTLPVDAETWKLGNTPTRASQSLLKAHLGSKSRATRERCSGETSKLGFAYDVFDSEIAPYQLLHSGLPCCVHSRH